MREFDREVFKILRALCAKGGYAVVCAGDVAAELSVGAQEGDVEAAVLRLAAEEFISLRFAEDGEYCYAVSGKEESPRAAESADNVRKRPCFVNLALTLAASLAGGAIGGAIGALIAGAVF